MVSISAGDLTSDLVDHICVQIEGVGWKVREVGVEKRGG